MKSVFQVTLCLSLLAAALPGAALAAEEFSKAGLIFWLKGDAGITKGAANKITEWQDQSGAGSHATGVAATAPVLTTEGGLSFAHFDAAAGNFLNISKPISATNFTIVAAIRFGAFPTDKFTFWFGGDGAQGCHAGGGVWSKPFVGWGMLRGTAEDWPFLVTAAAAPTDLGVISITNKHLYRNMLDAGVPTPFTSQPYQIQQHIPGMAFNILGTNSDKQYFTGDIFEVLVFNQSLTTGERVKVESYLMSRYNVAKPAYSAGEGPPTSGLALWLKADDGITKNGADQVTAWQDKSGKGRHATNADAATAPVFVTEGGRSFVRFTNTNEPSAANNKKNWLNCAVSAEKYTVFAAIRAKQPQVVKYDVHYSAPTFWFGGDNHGLIAGGGSPMGGNMTHKLGWGIQFSERGWQGLIQGRSVDTAFIVMTVNNYQLWRNGRSDVEMDRTIIDEHLGRYNPILNWSVPAINLTRLGGLPSMAGNVNVAIANFPGDIAEVLIYDKILPAPERGMVEEYLLTKYSIAAISPIREAPTRIAQGAPVLKGLQLQLPGSGVCAIDIFTPRGARAGSFQTKAPGVFDLSHAGLSNGVYQIRVRNGADIFWLKAPVLR